MNLKIFLMKRQKYKFDHLTILFKLKKSLLLTLLKTLFLYFIKDFYPQIYKVRKKE